MIQILDVLIVDDNRKIIRTLADIIRLNGYQCETANSGEEALEALGINPIDCVITDVKMPGMNGADLCQAVKVRQPDLPVVMMTAYANSELVQQGLEVGAIASLTKPVDIKILLYFLSSLRKERSIVIVSEDVELSKTTVDILKEQGLSVVVVTDPDRIFDLFDPEMHQVVLLDMQLTNQSGLEVLRSIRERNPRMPVILYSDHRDEGAADIEAGLELSAHVCLDKPLQIGEIDNALEEIYILMLRRTLINRRFN